MQVSIETLKGLERKVTVSIPTETIEKEVNLRLRDLARKVKVAGFRPGKVPMNIVRTRYINGVREEVARDMVQSTFFEALQESDLVLAGSPNLEPLQIESGKDFKYTASIEVFPEITITELNQDEVEFVESEIKESDVDNLVNKLRDNEKKWQEVPREAVMHDKVLIDFKGLLDGNPFEDGEAKDYEVIIGSNRMLPQFEQDLIGHTTESPFEITVHFPDDYNHKDLAGKDAVFIITIHKIMESILPELDDEFALKFDVTEGGMSALRKELQENMNRELEHRVNGMNRERLFDKLMEINQFDLPNVLIDKEIDELKHKMYHRIFGNAHSEHEKIPDFPKILFIKEAKRRIHLGLLFAEYVKLHKLVVDNVRVDAMIDKLASAYKNSNEVRNSYQMDKEKRAEIEALIMEEIVAEKIGENAKIIKKAITYEELMKPKPIEENETEEAS